MNFKHLYTAFACVLFHFMSVAQAPIANFTSDVTSGCSPIVVRFENLSTGNPTSWLWDFGNGATSTLQNPSATYFEPGTYTVTLTATNLSGDHSETKEAYITVVDPPQINFVSDKTSGCTPYAIQFSDQSSAAAGTINNAWFWDFGDGTQSTLQNPKKIYRTEDNFTVTLKVTNDKGCAKTITKPNYINITRGVVPAFTNSQSSVCSAPASVNFTNKSTGPGTISYSWDFGDGSTSTNASPSHTYIANGKYTVTLIASSSLGCSDTLRKDSVVVIGGFNTDFTVPNICAGGAVVQLTNASSPKPVSSLWRFPDGTTSSEINPKKSFAISGPIQITLINKYGTCTDSVIKTVDVSGKPAISFTTPDSVKCAPPSTVTFSNTTNAITYKWDFGDSTSSTETNPSHTYANFGNYSVSLVATDDKGCTDTLKKPDFIRIQKPVISFPSLPLRGCIPYINTYKADIKAVDKVTSYLWDFGDGTTSTLENPSHTYTQQGSYTISLTITTSTGCTETLRLADAVKVGTKPKADFVADKFDVCASSPISFTNLSPMPTDEYIWKFGDGSTSSVKNPKHEYSDTGFLHVTLIAFNSGCGDTLTKSNYVHIKPPIAKFTFRPDCDRRNEITFENKSIIDPTQPVTWAWNFGDGTPVYTGQTPPAHTFPTRYGSWNVSLSVTNGSCSFTYKETIKVVDQTPAISASVESGCKPFKTLFKVTGPVQLTQSVWNFGDGTSATVNGTSKEHTYFDAGSFSVRVTVTDKFGCLDSASKNLFINVYGPEADFVSSTNAGCRGMTTTFIDSTKTDGQHPIVKWQWNYGDGKTETSTTSPFQHTYDTTGTLPVSMMVEDSYGCIDSILKNNFIYLSSIKAQWNVGNRQTCPDANVQFNNTTAGTHTSIWDFGDSTISNLSSPLHAYADTGFYTIKLKVTDTIGCTDSLVRQRYVQVGAPKASFTENNLVSFCTPFEAKFTNTSSYYTSRSWNLGIATSRQENPSIYYTATGTYDVKLVITSHGGCKDSVIKQVRVFNPEDAVFTYGPDLVGCKPVTINFEAFAEMNASFIWDFGNGNVIDTTVNKIEHTYRDFGTFTPRIIMTEASGQCKIPLTGKDLIRVLGAKAKFGINQTLFCDSGYVQISDSTTFNDPIVRYTWNYGDGSVSSNPNDTLHRYGSPGNYDVFLTVLTQNGCIDSLRSEPIKVVQSPLISMQSEFEICANEFMRHAGVFERTDTSAVQWLWQFPNGNSASVQYPANQQYQIPGDYVVSAYATNSSGCADTALQNIRVYPIPEVTMPSTLTMQAGFPVTIPATYTSNVIGYSWQPANTLSCADCPQPIASPKFNTKYSVSFTDSNGCSNTGEVQVVVICMNANVFVPNTFSPNGDGSNDVFYVRGKGLERVKSLRIFNRWGEIVFEKRDFPVNDPSAAWNGSYKGNRPHADVYIYQVEVFCDNGDVIRFEGNVALIQ